MKTQKQRNVWKKDPQNIINGGETIRNAIKTSLESNTGCLIGKHGSVELDALTTQQLGPHHFHTLEQNAGVFPVQNQRLLQEWLNEYQSATAHSDVLGLFYFVGLSQREDQYLKRVAPTTPRVPLRSLEPYYSPTPWSSDTLANQHVCIVSPFIDSIKKQLDIPQQIWPLKTAQEQSSIWPNDLLPIVSKWSFVRSYYSPAIARGKCEWPSHVKSWKDAVDMMEEQVLETNARIVLIGCGGNGMPLAQRLKAHGKICIVLGGALQILFGVKGNRWNKHEVISKFFNQHWIKPLPHEVPNGATLVEGACYW